jgi:hypothetical protein
VWVQILGSLDGPHQLIEDDRLERLIGFTAPPDCSAVALVAGAWVGPMDSPDRPRDRERARTTCVVSRSGERAGRLRWLDGRLINEPPGAGRALDSLLRTFQLPTAPPDGSTAGLFAAQWLDHVLARAAASTKPLTWPQVAAIYPAMDVLRSAGEGVGAEDLVRVAQVAVKVWTWEEIRRAACTPGWLGDDMPLDAGHWMDEGMLSRWLVDRYPPLVDHLREADRLLPAGVARRIRRTLRGLDLLPDGN